MKKNKILIVDDNKLNRQSLADIFRKAYQIVESEDGKKALEFCCAARLCSSAGPKTHCGWGNIHQKRKALFVHVQLFHQRFNHIGAVVWTPGSLGNHLQSGIFIFFHFQILLLFVFQPYAGAKLIWLCFILLAKSGIE